MSVYWDNNKCDNCGISTVDPLEKLTCSGEQEGVECCPSCGFLPESPEEYHLTKKFILTKVMSAKY